MGTHWRSEQSRPDGGAAASFAALDDDPVVREALARLAARHGAGQADVALVEFGQGADGELLSQLSSGEHFCGIVLLSRDALGRAADEARSRLAEGSRFEPSARLRQACEEVLALERALDSRRDRRFRLSERERAVLGLMAEGATNSEIAAQLSISLSTVKSHVAQIMRKLGTRNRANAIVHYLTGALEEE